jgi:flagellar biosynthetic protein FlhB
MAEQNESAEKSHEASPERLKQARKKGNVPQSQELLTVARYTGMLIAVLGLSGILSMQFATGMIGFLDRPEKAAGWLLSGGDPWLVLTPSAIFLIGMLGLCSVLCIAALVAQRAITFAPSKLAPKLDKLSPIKNAGNKFGPTGLIEFARSSVKAVAVSIVAVVIVVADLPDLMAAVGGPVSLLARELRDVAIPMLIAAVVLAVLAAAIDVPVKWRQHASRLKMSTQEMKDEVKETEGDPEQKGKRRGIARQIAQNRQLADVPKADVVIVNPEHYAVALQWNREAGEVPRCIAKGVDHVALRIKTVAEEASVPVYRDVPTARSLYAAVEVGEEIRREHFEAVAAAIRFADKLKGLRRT